MRTRHHPRAGRASARRWLPIAAVWAVLSCPASPGHADAPPQPTQWSVDAPAPAPPGRSSFAATVGWPGLEAELRHGLARGLDIGVEGAAVIGSPLMGFRTGAGGSLSASLRSMLGRAAPWSLGLALEAGLLLGEPALLGSLSATRNIVAAPAWGACLLTGLDVSPDFRLSAGWGTRVAVLATPDADVSPWAAAISVRATAEGRLRPDARAFLRVEAGYGLADRRRFGSHAILRLLVGTAISL